MSAELFIDTNIFIYHLDGSDKRKHDIADRLIREGLMSGVACISFQVAQECLNTFLRKAESPLDPEQARLYLDSVLIPLMQVAATPALYHRALDIKSRYRFGFYDSLIVAGALAAGCRQLITEVLQHGLRIDNLEIHDPFRA
jgi:predicted nucleic acid-binding protein